ncbi:MAG: hypothetical protein V1769_05085 [Thermoplasmatota archaeon]
MKKQETIFAVYKQLNLQKLSKALERHQVDEQVIPLLQSINNDERYVTTSSCAGRIVVLEVPILGDKKQAVFHGCWHQSPSFLELKQALEKYSTGQLWFLAQPPIFHIGVVDLESANILLKTGILSGFKNSGVKTLKKHIVVELLSTERLDMPLGEKGVIYYDDSYLHFLLQTAEMVVERSKEKLDRLRTSMNIVLKK